MGASSWRVGPHSDVLWVGIVKRSFAPMLALTLNLSPRGEGLQRKSFDGTLPVFAPLLLEEKHVLSAAVGEAIRGDGG